MRMRNCMQGPLPRWLGAGLLTMSMLAGCGGGGGSDSVATPVAATPQTVILFLGAVSSTAEGADAIGNIGAPIELDASASKDAGGNALSFAWSIVSKPAGSTLNLTSATAAKLLFQADVLGSYVFKLRVSNSTGGYAEKSVSVLVNNRAPNAVAVINATFELHPVRYAPVIVSAGSDIMLNGADSTDAYGGKLFTSWEVTGKPAGSVVQLLVTGPSARFKADVPGLYTVNVRGANDKGAYSEAVYQLDATNALPTGTRQSTVAAISRDNQTVTVGQPVVTSGILSYDEKGRTLSYSWAVDTRPAGSVAVLGTSSSAVPSFMPDVSGTYVLSMTVSSGQQTAVAYLKLNAVMPSYKVVALPFRPLGIRYSRGIERLIMATANPDALKITNPLDGVSTSVSLPFAVKTFNLSADGKLAAVLHEGMLSLVDLETRQLLRSTVTADFPTEALITNTGLVFLTGQSKGAI